MPAELAHELGGQAGGLFEVLAGDLHHAGLLGREVTAAGGGVEQLAVLRVRGAGVAQPGQEALLARAVPGGPGRQKGALVPPEQRPDAAEVGQFLPALGEVLPLGVGLGRGHAQSLAT